MEVTMKLMTPAAIERRKKALAAREKQLQKGTKPNKFGTTQEKKDKPEIPLTEKDRSRIENEISSLKSRIY